MTLDGGETWFTPLSTTVDVGHNDIHSGVIRLRIKASNELKLFRGVEAISEQGFTYVEFISLESVTASIKDNTIRGTNTSMEYAIKQAEASDSLWYSCDNIITNFDYPLQGDFTVYIRQIGNPSNNSKVLIAPKPEAGPVYSLDYFKECVVEPVSIIHEYAYNKDMLNAVRGDGSSIVKVDPARDTAIFFRTLPTDVTVPSHVTKLIIPDRPDLQIPVDYTLEKTVQDIPASMLYWRSPDLSDSIRGSGAKLNIQPLDSIWFTQNASDTAFHSDTFKLVTPARPLPPEFSIDFYNETTFELVSDSIIWSMTENMANLTRGENDVIDLVPGMDMLFAVATTDTGFGSFAYHLEIPVRPLKPQKPTIDFFEEKLTGLNETIEVETNDGIYTINDSTFDLQPIIPASGYVTVEARVQSDGMTRFASESQFVVIPGRPDVPFVELQHLVSDKGAVFINGGRARAQNGLEYQVDNGPWIKIDETTVIEIGGTREIIVRLAATKNSFKSKSSSDINFKLDAQLIDLIVVDGRLDSRLILGGIQHFSDNNIQVFSRWGDLVYEADNYQNEFDFAQYPAGTYYYIVSYTHEGVKKQFKNFVEVIKK